MIDINSLSPSDLVNVLSDIEQESNRRAANSTLKSFVHLAWPYVEPTTQLLWNWHLDELCSALESVTRGEQRRCIFNIPPGMMKSLLVSVFWPAWEWTIDPSLRYLTASYSDDNTIRDNIRVRSIVKSKWYQSLFNVRITSEQWAKIRFDTTAGGCRIATSVGGMGTGEHPDRIIIDDPHKAKEVPTKASRDAVGDWFQNTLSTRKARNPAIILIMQRLHQDDLSGRLLKRSEWQHLCFPMRYEVGGEWECPCHQAPDTHDPRTVPGALLWPALWPESKVREEEIDLGPLGTSGQLQQRPTPITGGMFKREWFSIVDIPPINARRCRGWDTAGTEGGGDWTVGVRLSEDNNGIVYVEHMVRERSESIAVDEVIRQTADIDGKSCAIREEREPGSSGLAVIAFRARALKGYDYSGVPTTGDKITRAKPFRSQAQAGNVRLVKGTWNEDYLDVVCSFPLGMHDDCVDASSCAYNALVSDKPKVTRATWGSRNRR